MNFVAKALVAVLVSVLFTPAPAAMAAPVISITKAIPSPNSLTVYWSVKNAIKGSKYGVAFKPVGASKFNSIKSSSNTAIITNLKSLTRYAVYVYQISGAKKMFPSKQVFFITSEPGILNLQQDSVSHTSAKVSWTPHPIYSKYRVRINEGTPVEVSTPNHVISNLKPGINHNVQVAGLIGNKEGAYSEKLVIELDASGPTNYSTASVTTTSFEFGWNAISGVTGYKVYKDDIYITTVTTNSAKIVGLSPGASGTVSVSGIFGTTETQKTLYKYQTLIDIPAAPTAVSNTATSITVGWKADVNATGYTVSLNDVSGTLIKSYVASSNATSYTITGLATLTPYTVTITYQYGATASKSSPSTAVTTAREIPTGLVASAIKTTTFTLGWNPIPGAYGYEIYKDGALVIQLTDPNSVSYAMSGAPGNTHLITVRARYYDQAKVITTSDLSASLSVTMLSDSNYSPAISVAPLITLPYASVPIIGATLNSNSGTWTGSPLPTSYSYQWQKSLDGGSTWNDLPGASSSSYTVNEADYQFNLRVKVTATNTNGSTSAYSVLTGLVNSVYNTAVPIVRGTLVVGQILDVTQGSWSSPYTLSFTYKWYRSGSAISGATAPTYTLTDNDVAATIDCIVTAITKYGSSSVTSVERSAVQAVAATVSPVITGTIRVASTLSTSDGTWIGTPDSYGYQWQRSADGNLWDSISGATNSTYALTSSEAGFYVRALVYGLKTISGTLYRVTAPTGNTLVPVPVYNISNTVAPTVSGAWTEGVTLTANNGTWSATGTFTYQWQSSSDNSTFSDISGATSKTYVLTSGEASKYVRVRVYNTTSTGDGVAYSIATSKVGAPYCTAVPVITSSLRVGNTQSVSTGTWDNIPTSYTYQWQSSSNGIAWSNADTGTASSYIATFDVANKYIRVLVTATNATGSTTMTVGNISGFLAPVATAIPVISGTVSGTNTLTTSTGTWPSMNGQTPYEYQWQRSSDNGATWTNISGAMSSTYSLVAADQGYIIRSQVSVRTNAGTSTSYSIPTAAVG